MDMKLTARIHLYGIDLDKDTDMGEWLEIVIQTGLTTLQCHADRVYVDIPRKLSWEEVRSRFFNVE